jgi:two-component system sensor histidine kinase KdpD
MRSHILAAVVSVGSVAAVTGVVFALRPVAPVLSLGVLYVVAVVTVAMLFGLAYAIPVSIASMLAFNFFFLPPVHTFALRDSANWVALGVYVATGVAVSELATRSRRRARDAEQREREATFLAEASATLLEAERVAERLKDVGAGAGAVLGLRRARIELESLRRPEPGETAYDLDVGRRHVGRLFFESGHADTAARERILPALASLLAVAGERERLARAALEAETLRRSDAVKTAVLRSVSHDLRSPITAIRAAADGLAGGLELGAADRTELLSTISEEAARLERLVKNLIDLSRLEAGAARPRPELWTLDELIARSLAAVDEPADRIHVELVGGPFATLVDAAQIERALVNVVENALKFSPGPVHVIGAAEEDRVLVSVRDHGPGLDPREIERIFEPFELGRAASATGTGLGLAIAAGFAQANGATLSAAPAADDGTIFTLALPRAELPVGVRT